MFKFKRKIDKELTKLSDEELASLPLATLQRIRNKRYINNLHELTQRAEEELKRRDPKINWKCTRCGKDKYHQSEARMSGSMFQAFWGWERQKYHAIICNYCGKTEFYSVLMTVGEERISFFGN